MGPIQKKSTRQDGSFNSRGFSLQLRILRLGLLQDGDVGSVYFRANSGVAAQESCSGTLSQRTAIR
jgi:hypothetical protein